MVPVPCVWVVGQKGIGIFFFWFSLFSKVLTTILYCFYVLIFKINNYVLTDQGHQVLTDEVQLLPLTFIITWGRTIPQSPNLTICPDYPPTKIHWFQAANVNVFTPLPKVQRIQDLEQLPCRVTGFPAYLGVTPGPCELSAFLENSSCAPCSVFVFHSHRACRLSLMSLKHPMRQRGRGVCVQSSCSAQNSETSHNSPLCSVPSSHLSSITDPRLIASL